MILKRIALRAFKGVEHAEFDELSPRLNLFVGANETGKSTIVDALHFGLFETSAGVAEHKRELRSWGRDDAPEVEIDFIDASNELWHLHKRFLTAPVTTLQGRNVTLRGGDAERRLRTMFGTKPGTRHGVKAGDLGIWPVLWIRQGESGRAMKDVVQADARERLRVSLTTQTGRLAAGEKAASVRDALRQRVEAVHTPAGRARGALGEALARVSDLNLELAQAQQTLNEAHAARAQVTRLRPHRAGLVARLAAIEQEIAQTTAESTDFALAASALEAIEARHAQAHHELERLRAQGIAARERVQARALAEERLVAAREALAHAQTELALAERDLSEAFDAQRAFRHRVPKPAPGSPQSEAARVRLAECHQRTAEIFTLDQRLRALPEPKALERISHLHEQLEARRSAALSGRVAVEVVSAEGVRTLWLEGERSIDLGGGLHLRRAQLPDALVAPEAAQVLADALRAAGLADVAQAHALAQERSRLERERTVQIEALHILAPQGLGVLEQSLAPVLSQVSIPPGQHEVDQRVRDAQARAQQALANVEALNSVLAQPSQLPPVWESPSAEELSQAEDALAALQAELTRAQQAHARHHAWSEQLQVLTRAAEVLKVRIEATDTELAQACAEVARAQASGVASRVFARARDLEAAQADLQRLERAAQADKTALDAVEQAWRRHHESLAGPVREMVLAELPILFPGSEPALDEDGDLIGITTRGVTESFHVLSAGTAEQLGVLARLALARVLAPDHRVPIVLDDALVHSDAERRARVVQLLRRASVVHQLLVFTCHDDDFDKLAADRVWEVRARPTRFGR